MRVDRQRGDAQADERALATRTEIVDGPREQFLAGAGLAPKQHGGVGRRDGLDGLQHAFEGRTVADDLAEVVLEADLAPARYSLLVGELILDAGDLLVRQRVLHRDRDLRGNLLQQLDVAGGNASGSTLATFSVPRLPRRVTSGTQHTDCDARRPASAGSPLAPNEIELGLAEHGGHPALKRDTGWRSVERQLGVRLEDAGARRCASAPEAGAGPIGRSKSATLA